MKISQTTLIPIELYTHEARKYIEKAFSDKGILKYIDQDDQIIGICKELLPDETLFYDLILNNSKIKTIFFLETGIIMLTEHIFSTDFQNEQLDDLNKILINRRRLHIEIIEEKDAVIDLIKQFTTELNKEKKMRQREFFKFRINYAFSFFVLLSEFTAFEQEINFAKILAEPSLIGSEDMVSIERKTLVGDLRLVSNNKLKEIKNIDLLSNAQTFITWASIASIVDNEDDWQFTKNLLTVLEIRTQSIWNKCYCVNRDIDYIIQHEIYIKRYEMEKIYWGTINTIDKAKGVISSTFSSRAGVFFEKILYTSNLYREVDKLKDKLFLLEKYLKEKTEKSEKMYKKFLNFSLLLIMTFTMLPAFVKTPILKTSLYGWLIVSIVLMIGVIVNLKIDS